MGGNLKIFSPFKMTPPTFPIKIDVLAGVKDIGNYETDKEYQHGCFYRACS